MALEGVHHITAITADAPRNVDFYRRVLGLRMVKKTVNFDAPDVYHLYYGDDQGTPGSIMTFFEFPDAAPGSAGDGMVHRILWRAPAGALDYWAARLTDEGAPVTRGAGGSVVFADPEGLAGEIVHADVADAPLVAEAPDIPADCALQGFHGVRAYTSRPERSAPLLAALGFEDEGDGVHRLGGSDRVGLYVQDSPPTGDRAARPIPGAGTVHHVAWSAADDAELAAVRAAAAAQGARATGIIDRQYFHSVYFREPGGVLFELATRDIGFAVDEPAEALGEALKLPPQHEHLRAELERTLTPLPA